MNSSLNHIYRVVWNASLGLWQVASEVARNGGRTQSEQRKTRRMKVGAAAVAGAFAGLASLSIPSIAFAQLPTGGQVVGGQASIVQNGNALNINQGTDRAAIDWQSFNVGQGNTVNFNQPSASSIALNRVLGSDVSVIQGAINANGQVFLVNQNGILFTPTAQVNVGGIVASTQSISTADFMAGKYTFSGNSTGTVENQGNITTSNGGTVALIAAKIINTGTITAPQGTVGLAAGNTVTLDLGGPVKIQVTQGALNTAIEQGGGIVADGGQIYLTAKAAGNLAASVINHTGITRARTLAGNQKGEIILIADMEVGTTTVAGTLDASAPNGGDGGFIETSAANVKIQDGVNITTQSAQGKNGQWLIDPHDFTIAASGGDITGAALGTALANNSVTIQTLASSVSCTGATCGTGKADGNGDIFVNDAINAGTSTNTLTLQAHRDINVNKTVTVGGLNLTAVRNVNVNDVVNVNNSLAVNYGANTNFTPNTTVRLSDNSSLNMKMTIDGFVGKINLGASATSAIINGSNYTIIRDRAGLLNISAVSSSLAGRYVLANDIDLGSSWTPIGFGTVGFSGFFEGLGHIANNMNVTTPLSSISGFFNIIANSTSISNLGVAGNISVSSGLAGGLAGSTGSAADILLRNIYSKVNVSTGSSNAGGLLGNATNGTTIINAMSVGQSIKTTTGSAGGVIGQATFSSGARVRNVLSTANVDGATNAGGLIGFLSVGVAGGDIGISNVYATGDVTGGSSTATGIGGLIGRVNNNDTTRHILDNAFASGKVTQKSASALQGGLVGLIGTNAGSSLSISNAYWDSTKSGQNSVTGSTVGLTTTKVSNVSIGTAGTLFPDLDSNVWSVVNGTPVLKVFQSAAPMVMPIFIRLDCGLCESIYGETPQFSFKAFTAASGGAAVTDAMLTGTALYSLTNGGVAAGTELGRLTDAGTYAVTYTSGLTGSSMYELSAGAATNFTIKPKLLTVAIQAALGSPLSKVYDGNQNIALAANNFAISGFVDQQGVGASVSGVASGSFNNANVAQANTITAELAQNSIVLPSTAKAGNYTLPTTASGAGTITPKALTITTNDFVSSATAMAAVTATNGLVGDQSVSAVNLDGKNLSVAFGQDTLSSNYATTVVVPGASGADLAVNRDLTLASGLNLTLRADKNILVNKVIDATTGTGSKVSLEFGQGAVAAGNTAEYVMNLVDTTFNGKINLLKGQNFATKQGSDGEVLNYTVITELGAQGSTTGMDLQGINGAANLAGRYVLGGDIDAMATAQWDGGAGFKPILTPGTTGRVGTPAVPFSGTFDGLGHSVSNLTINRASTDSVGLFGESTGHIRHVGLLGGSVTGRGLTGALVGQQSGGSIRHVYSTASVFGTQDVGGLVGRLQNFGSVRHARSSGAVSGTKDGIGGLIGSADASTVTHSRASGNVNAPAASNVGGAVGVASRSTLTDVSASGQVTGSSSTGGLIGSLSISILSRALASGAVNGPEVSTTSTARYGGLVGNASDATINDVFATGAVNAGALQQVGGLIGRMSAGSLTNGYATGAVMGATDVGGLVGTALNSPTLSNSFWNTLATGRETAVGSGDLSATSMGNAGKTTAQLQNAFTFIDAGWNFETVWGKSITGANAGNMQLRSFTNDNFDDYVRVADASKVYGAANSTITGAAVSGVGAANVTASFGSAVGELSDAGEYLQSTENVLNVTNKVAGRTTFVERAGKLTITPKALTVALQAAMNNPLSKVYDGNETIALGSGNFALSGFVGSQGVGATLGGVTSGTFNSKNVLQATTVSADIAKATLSGTAEGFKSSNYSLPTGPVTAAGTITPKALTITTNDFVSSATANTAIASTNGLVGDQSVSAVNLDGKNLSVAFGQDTLSSNYATTVVVPGASGADLAVNRDLTLASGLNLTLRADKNILVNKVIDATTGTGSKVTLEFGQGAVAAGNTAEYVMNLVDTTFNGKINLLKGQNFATKQGSDGQVLNYTVITELGAQGSTTGTDLQGINQEVLGGPANLSGRYVLGGDIDATATAQWNGGSGFTPIIGRPLRGAVFTPFLGTFDGLGHSVSNLTIDRKSFEFVGLFGQSTGHIRHVGLLGGNVDGLSTTGALVGQQSGGSIRHVYSTASVFGSQDVGGLVGRLQNSGSVRHARSSGAVVGIGSNVGGLIGRVASESTVSNSHASGNVFAINSPNVGGLVGIASNSTLTDVSASGQVTGDRFTGGLIGRLNNSILSRAFASGAVNGPTMPINSTNGYGGLVGIAESSTISDVFATGAVNVGAFKEVGGLVGSLSGGSLTNGYATGAVMGATEVGGLVGIASNSPTLSNSFWNTLATGRDNAVGAGELSATSMGNAGKTTAQLQNAFTFIDAGWNFETVWGKSITGANGGNMQLRSFTNDNFDDYVRVADASKVYGAANSTIIGAAVSGVGAANVTASFGSAVGELSDAGEYLQSTENVLNVTNKVAGRTTFVERAGKLTITPKALTVALQAAMNNPLSKVYDGNETIALGSGNFALSGFVGSQGVGATLGGVTSGTFNSKNVLQATTVSADIAKATLSGTAQGFKASNYSLPTTPVTAAGTITAKALTIAGTTVANKDYDGNINATVTAGTLSGVVEGETLGTTTATGQFAGKDVVRNAQGAATAQNVTVAYTLANGANAEHKASNYTLAGETKTATINPKALTIAGSTAANKTYDGTTAATVTAGTLSGLVGGETLGATTATGQFADKNAGTGKNVTVAYTLVDGVGRIEAGTPIFGPGGSATSTTPIVTPGAKASNYSLAGETLTANIAQKQVSITEFAAANKVYDGNTTATISNAGKLNGVLEGDAAKVALTNTGATFDTKDAGTGKTVTLNGKALTGDEAKNYVLASDAVTTKADIAQKQLTVTGFAAGNKTYDGNTTATISNAGTLNGVVQGDAGKVTLNNTGATFDTKDAGAAKTVTLNGKTLSGDEAKNYVLASEAVTAKADIAQKQLTIAEFAAANKVYDGNTTATISNAGKLLGVVEGDTGKVALGNTGATFDTKNAGTGKTVTLNGANITGTEAANYTLALTAVTAKADIAKKEITLAGFDAANKVYDGNTVAQIVSSGSLTGVVQNDTVMVSNNGATFDNKNAGTGKTVTLNGVALSGSDAGNYSIASTATDTADITKKAITLAGFDAANKVYDGNTTAQVVNSGSLTGVVTNDTVMVSNNGATFDTKNAGTGKTVTLNGVALSGSDAGNYSIANTATDTANITQKAITLTGFDAANKVYDGNTTAQILNSGSLAGVVEKDTVMVSNSGATFDNRNAGTAKTVTLNGVALSGTDAGNYSIANIATDTADITKRGGVVLTAQNKEKQLGAADPVLTFEVTGLVQGDSLTGSLSRVAGETPGFYAINRGTVDNPNYEISQFNAGQLQINQSLPQETIATVNTLSSPELRPSLGERPPLDQGGVPQSQAQDTPFLVTPSQANVGGPAQVVVIEGGINLNFAGGSENQGN